MAQTEASVTQYITDALGPLAGRLAIPSSAIVDTAAMVQAVYGAAYEDFTDELKWRTIADFYAMNTALTYCTMHYRFASDGATIDGDDVFQHVQLRWNSAFALAQGYLAEAGIIATMPGGSAVHRNFGFRMGSINTKYLTDEEPGVPI